MVSSNATCLPEVYGEAAHYFDPLDIQAMADAINEVLTDKALRAELVENGQEQAAKYSWQRLAEQTLEVYEKALAARTQSLVTWSSPRRKRPSSMRRWSK